jgi:hypothetical protein
MLALCFWLITLSDATGQDAMASFDATFTINDAVEFFGNHPIPITEQQLRTLIDILNIRPVGKRQGPRGRPALTYDIAELQTLHAAIAPWLPPHEEPRQAFSSIGKCPTMIHCAQARRQEGLAPLQPIEQEGPPYVVADE